jgi:hypothetical protein
LKENQTRKGRNRRPLKRRESRAKLANYRRCQQLFTTNKRRLADALFNGADANLVDVDLPLEELKNIYSELWGTSGRTFLPPSEAGTMKSLVETFPAITPEEVGKRISKIKPSSSPGPDGIRKNHLRDRKYYTVLAKFFNILMMTGVYPESWRRNRVIFIPKRGKDTTLAGSWRPITIASMLARIYSGLLDGRLRGDTRLVSHQRGFTSFNGCHANLVILNNVIRRAKSGGGGVVVAVDIAKAFDTVPHASILAALRD